MNLFARLHRRLARRWRLKAKAFHASAFEFFRRSVAADARADAHERKAAALEERDERERLAEPRIRLPAEER